MGLRPPTESELRKLGEDFHLDLTDEECTDFEELIERTLDMYEAVREASSPPDPTPAERRLDAGRRATDDDPYNAWITRCNIERDTTGRLDGWRIGLKDNVSVAGVEMTCGSAVLEGYTPRVDAEIVTRLLEAGGRIVGKNNMDDMAFAGNGSSSAFGPVVNPWNDEYLAGGSSGGGAAAIATGEIELAIGTDQGGSVRVPAAWSGVVGHKPTFGLVPYTGIVGLRQPLDHVGILTNSVEQAARSLTVLAGKDPRDPRQPETVPVEAYETALDGDASDLKIAVLEEGFSRNESDDAVTDEVRTAVEDVADRGATVESISLPAFDTAPAVYTVAMLEGLVATVRGEGIGHNHRGWHDTTWMESFGKYRRTHGRAFPATVKLGLLVGAYTSEFYHSKYYARAVNLIEAITEMFDELFETYDVLALPTTPGKAQVREPDLDRIEFVARAWTSLANASIFSATGHPAISVPIGRGDGLPVGLQLVGARFDDATVLNAARTVEREQ